MKRLIPTLSVACALTAPLAAMAESSRASSPARQLLHRLIVSTPVHVNLWQDRSIAGVYSPHAVLTRHAVLVELPATRSARFEIGHDGTLAFTMGCNRFRSSIAWHAERVIIGPVAGTRMACPESLSTDERRVLHALDVAVRIENSATNLRFLDDQGRAVLILDRRDL